MPCYSRPSSLLRRESHTSPPSSKAMPRADGAWRIGLEPPTDKGTEEQFGFHGPGGGGDSSSNMRVPLACRDPGSLHSGQPVSPAPSLHAHQQTKMVTFSRSSKKGALQLLIQSC